MRLNRAARWVPILIVLASLAMPGLARAGAGDSAQPTAATARAGELMRSGAEAFARGDYGAAERDWRQAELAYAAAGDVGGQLDAWLNLGIVQQQLGHFQPHAIQTLEAARRLAEEHGRADKLVEIDNALGVAYTFTRQPERAEETLNGALKLLAGQGGDAGLEASLRNNLGNLYAAWAEVAPEEEKTGRYDSAFEHFARAAELAGQAGDAPLAAKATVNAALSAARGGRFEQAGLLNAKAIESVGELPASLDRANLLIAIGQTDQRLLDARAAWPEPADSRSKADLNRARIERRAFDAYDQARLLAKAADNPLVGSYAVGYQGRLYEFAGRHDEALALTRRAVLLAQRARSPDSLYLWHWQTGRLLNAQGKRDEAIAAYTRARDTLEAVRSDLALGYGNRGMRATFRSEAGPLYYELADLLLARADDEGDAARVQQYLSDARNTVERLRVGELESYLEDACVNQAQAQQTDLTRDLGQIPRGSPAVVYLIPLADRVEILVTTRLGMTRVTSPGVGAAQLTKEVREFRRRLENRVNHRYLTHGKRLYDWLIKPIEALLAEQKIDTLVFVPDGALRTVPMSALYDGTDFLVARYAVAVSPGLSLRLSDDRDPAEVSRGAARVLASGLSVTPPNETTPPLPNVAEELASIERIYGATTLLDEEFRVPTFSGALSADRVEGEEFSIVHIASHGEFAADVADTFVLTYEGRLNLNSLESLLRPYQLRGRPIDLLTLSCCQTSAGDDEAARERASLGLGGLAVKAGARSAMASLWFANDEATSELVTAFYQHLRDHPEAGKAQALRHAQLKLIRNEDFSHPLYWAPFLMIGDWL